MVVCLGGVGEHQPREVDMAVVVAEAVPSVLRGPWRGTPVVALGAKVCVWGGECFVWDCVVRDCFVWMMLGGCVDFRVCVY